RIALVSDVGEDILDELDVHLVSPWKLRAVAFSILPFALAQIIILFDVTEENFTLLLSRNYVGILCRTVVMVNERDFICITRNIDQVVSLAVAVEVGAIRI